MNTLVTATAHYADISKRLKTANDNKERGILTAQLNKAKTELQAAYKPTTTTPSTTPTNESTTPTIENKPVKVENMALDFWRVFATEAGRALLREIVAIVDGYEAPRRGRPLRKTERENYEKLLHALAANLGYHQLLHQATLHTKGGLYVTRSKRILGKKAEKHTSAPTFVNECLIRLLDTFTATDLIRQIVPAKETRGRVVNHFSKHKRHGDSTVIFPSGRFVKIMAECLVKSLADIRRDAQGEEIVLLKSLRADSEDHWSDSHEVSYDDDCQPANKFRDILKQIQQRLDAASMVVIHGNKPSTTTGVLIDTKSRRLRRVFTRQRWDSCGRMYGGWWMPLSKEERLERIVLDGHRVAELDFSSMAVRLAYGLAGVDAPAGDQYAVPGFERSRDCMKVLFSALLFDKPGYNRKKLPADAAKGLHPDEKRPVGEIIGAVKAYHDPLVEFLGAGIGHDLFFTESEIMTTILLKLNELGIVGLPVHDALYVPLNRVEETRKIMEEAFREIIGLEGVLKVTRPAGY